jgi:uncharacterized protein YndB with AHSA1/START domain
MTTVTEIATTQVYQLFIKATPEQIWEAITNPDFTQKYFHGTRIKSTFEPGSEYGAWSSDESQLLVDGEVLESDPPNRLSTTWRALYDPETATEPHSRVSWEIEAQEGGYSKLTVVHDQLEESLKTAANVGDGGWSHVLSALKTYLETGKPLAG